MPTLRQLQNLLAVAETGHFGRAAEMRRVSQPALSMQIRELEKALGLTLVDRGGPRAVLTPDGEEVLSRARLAIAAVKDIEDYGRQRSGVLVGPFQLGIIPSVAPYLLPGLLSAIAQRYPALDLRLRESLTASLLDELSAGELDAVVCALPVPGGDFTSAAFLEDEFLVAVPADQASTWPEEIDQIDPEGLMLLEEGHCLRDQALSVCSIAPGRLRSLGATSLATLLQMVAAGRGITLVPKIAADTLADPRIVLRRFRAPRPSRTLGLVWRRSSPRDDDHRALHRLLASTSGPQDRP